MSTLSYTLEDSPKEIWLEPQCSPSEDEGRTWAIKDAWGACQECGSPAVQYIRADIAASPSPAYPADDVAEPLQNLEQFVDADNRHWVPLREAAAALSRLQARAETAEEHIAVLETQITTVIISAEEYKARAEAASASAATMREALREANRKIAGMQLAFQDHLAALGGQHG